MLDATHIQVRDTLFSELQTQLDRDNNYTGLLWQLSNLQIAAIYLSCM